MLEIVEKFITLSGEAPAAGYPVFLIRFAECNLQCRYCDTMYCGEVNEKTTVEKLCSEIRDREQNYPGIKIMFTGGEPLLADRQKKLVRIMKKLPDSSFYIETNGSQVIEDFNIPGVHYVADWKTPSSGYGDCFCLENLPRYRPANDCIKIVTAEEDLQWVLAKVGQIKKVNPLLPVYLSPQAGNISLEKLASFIMEHKLPVSLSLQMHKIIWGDKRGV